MVNNQLIVIVNKVFLRKVALKICLFSENSTFAEN